MLLLSGSTLVPLSRSIPAVPTLTISQLKQAAVSERVEAAIHVQIQSLHRKATRDGKPFWELILADAEGRITLRAWSDAPAYGLCEDMVEGAFLEITGEWAHSGQYGVEAKTWRCRDLTIGERDTLLAGPPELCARQAADCAFLEETVNVVGDPRLRALGQLFFREHGERFRRTAAARANHHARRGGLVEHTAQMMRMALATAAAYPTLNRDLLAAGVLFHDCGKLWENALPIDGFTMGWTERAELLGHIPIGIEVVNGLWRRLLALPEAHAWGTLRPGTEDVRLHLLHLVAAHHGSLEFGSPVVPKTPEAWALHYIDNLDAKVEMLTAGYGVARLLGPGVYEKVWPLPGNFVAPLAPFEE